MIGEMEWMDCASNVASWLGHRQPDFRGVQIAIWAVVLRPGLCGGTMGVSASMTRGVVRLGWLDGVPLGRCNE